MIPLKKYNLKSPLVMTILILFFSLGILSVLYFSWLSSPKLGLNILVPHWISSWADKHEYFNIRTAIPMTFLGFISSCLLSFRKSKLQVWIFVWLFLIALVILAEVGQLLLPLRSFDLKDIYWGALGAFIPLFIAYLYSRYNKN